MHPQEGKQEDTMFVHLHPGNHLVPCQLQVAMAKVMDATVCSTDEENPLNFSFLRVYLSKITFQY